MFSFAGLHYFNCQKYILRNNLFSNVNIFLFEKNLPQFLKILLPFPKLDFKRAFVVKCS